MTTVYSLANSHTREHMVDPFGTFIRRGIVRVKYNEDIEFLIVLLYPDEKH
jgi:hypothetical protein